MNSYLVEESPNLFNSRPLGQKWVICAQDFVVPSLRVSLELKGL